GLGITPQPLRAVRRLTRVQRIDVRGDDLIDGVIIPAVFWIHSHVRLFAKSEIRISKSETSSKFECSKPRNKRGAALSAFGISDFEFASDFEIRISDFPRLVGLQQLAQMPEAAAE